MPIYIINSDCTAPATIDAPIAIVPAGSIYCFWHTVLLLLAMIIMNDYYVH